MLRQEVSATPSNNSQTNGSFNGTAGHSAVIEGRVSTLMDLIARCESTLKAEDRLTPKTLSRLRFNNLRDGTLIQRRLGENSRELLGEYLETLTQFGIVKYFSMEGAPLFPTAARFKVLLGARARGRECAPWKEEDFLKFNEPASAKTAPEIRAVAVVSDKAALGVSAVRSKPKSPKVPKEVKKEKQEKPVKKTVKAFPSEKQLAALAASYQEWCLTAPRLEPWMPKVVQENFLTARVPIGRLLIGPDFAFAANLSERQIRQFLHEEEDPQRRLLSRFVVGGDLLPFLKGKGVTEIDGRVFLCVPYTNNPIPAELIGWGSALYRSILSAERGGKGYSSEQAFYGCKIVGEYLDFVCSKYIKPDRLGQDWQELHIRWEDKIQKFLATLVNADKALVEYYRKHLETLYLFIRNS